MILHIIEIKIRHLWIINQMLQALDSKHIMKGMLNSHKRSFIRSSAYSYKRGHSHYIHIVWRLTWEKQQNVMCRNKSTIYNNSSRENLTTYLKQILFYLCPPSTKQEMNLKHQIGIQAKGHKSYYTSKFLRYHFISTVNVI